MREVRLRYKVTVIWIVAECLLDSIDQSDNEFSLRPYHYAVTPEMAQKICDTYNEGGNVLATYTEEEYI